MSPSSEKLVDYLARTQNCSLRQAKSLLDARVVFVNGKRIWMAKHPVRDTDRVELQQKSPPTAQQQSPRAAILLDAGDVFVINKPPGLLANGPKSAETFYQQHELNPLIRAVHRIDKDTSGCLCLARTEEAFERMVQQFRDQQIRKIYRAIVVGHPPREGSCSLALDGRSATTHWRSLAQSDCATLLHIKIETGRTHQIRRHFSQMGYPIAGDRQYHTRRITNPRIRRIPRQMLHASIFEACFDHRGTQRQTATAPDPSDFCQAIQTLNLGRPRKSRA